MDGRFDADLPSKCVVKIDLHVGKLISTLPIPTCRVSYNTITKLGNLPGEIHSLTNARMLKNCASDSTYGGTVNLQNGGPL